MNKRLQVYRNHKALNMPSKVIQESDIKAGSPQGIAISHHSRMWAVVDQNQVYIFDGRNQLVRKIRKYTVGGVVLDYCQGIAFDADNNLYVTGSNFYVTGSSCVKKFDMHGNYLLQFKGSDSGEDQLQDPRGIVIHDGKVYVADSKGSGTVNNPRKGNVSTFQCDGQFCASFGSDKLQSAYDVAVNADNQILVADYDGNCVHVFALDGQHISRISFAISVRNNLNCPNSLATDKNGFIFITDGYDRVTVFDKCGNFIHSFFGSQGKHNTQCIENNYYTVAVNFDGDVYVLDSKTKTVQIFDNY